MSNLTLLSSLVPQENWWYNDAGVTKGSELGMINTLINMKQHDYI